MPENILLLALEAVVEVGEAVDVSFGGLQLIVQSLRLGDRRLELSVQFVILSANDYQLFLVVGEDFALLVELVVQA